MKEIKYSLEDLASVAQEILQESKSRVVLFYAKMGVGKTTLIKELVKALGSEDIVSSPTFALVNEYAGQEEPIYHFDLYRIEDPTEAMDIGIEEYFYSDCWCFVEWPEKIEELLPEDGQKIYIERLENGENLLRFA